MNTIACLDQRLGWTKRECGASVALVFEDAETRGWAEGVRDLMIEQAGEDVLQFTGWQIGNLAQPGYFTRGIQALAKAEAIVIAVHEVDRFPGSFYLWVNLWLQVRSGKPGALVALVGTSGGHTPESIETRRYISAVASQGGLELFTKEYDSKDLSTAWNHITSAN